MTRTYTHTKSLDLRAHTHTKSLALTYRTYTLIRTNTHTKSSFLWEPCYFGQCSQCIGMKNFEFIPLSFSVCLISSTLQFQRNEKFSSRKKNLYTKQNNKHIYLHCTRNRNKCTVARKSLILPDSMRGARFPAVKEDEQWTPSGKREELKISKWKTTGERE